MKPRKEGLAKTKPNETRTPVLRDFSMGSSVEIFNKYANRYDLWYERNRITAENEARLIKKISSGARTPCIDVGGGAGYFAQILGCINIDPSHEMLAISKIKRGVESVQGYGEYLPIRSESIWFALIVVTICFVESPKSLLVEVSRALKRGGNMVLCIIPRDSPWGEHYAHKKDSPFYSVARFLTRKETIDLIYRVGLEIETIMGTLSYPPWLEPYLEDPQPDRGEYGFICIRSYKNT
jgi:ubiquinone/menaquinone biosynthesis C-methylase UbiE